MDTVYALRDQVRQLQLQLLAVTRDVEQLKSKNPWAPKQQKNRLRLQQRLFQQDPVVATRWVVREPLEKGVQYGALVNWENGYLFEK